jgi:hypothetical protein
MSTFSIGELSLSSSPYSRSLGCGLHFDGNDDPGHEGDCYFCGEPFGEHDPACPLEP